MKDICYVTFATEANCSEEIRRPACKGGCIENFCVSFFIQKNDDLRVAEAKDEATLKSRGRS